MSLQGNERFQPLVVAAGLLLLGGALAAPARAQDLRDIFDRGTTAYARGDYTEAIETWSLLVDAGIDDPDLSFNLGNAYAKTQWYGHAIRWYERSLRRRPGDADVERSLAEVTKALGEARAEREGEVTLESRPSFAQLLVRPLSEDTLSILVLVLDFLFFALLTAWVRVRAEAGRLGLGIAIPVVGLALAFAALGLTIKAGWLSAGELAVVTATDAALRETPDPRSQTRATAAEGARTRIVEREQGWCLVELPSGERGWLLADDVGTI